VAISKREPLAPRLGKGGLCVVQRFGKAVRRQPRATIAPVMVRIQSRSCGALLLRKMRPTARPLLRTS
jgi:hypothetical protein